ncbi:MAG: hypothetical protein WCS87_15140 [Methylococcaceae bacterium]
MKHPDLFKLIIGLGFFSFSMPGLTDSASNQQITDIACRYETTITPDDKSIAPTTTTWFFWRKSNMIQTQDESGRYGEVWEKTVTGNIQYRKLYPSHKTAVEYMPADSTTHNLNFDWNKLSNMLSQQELDALKPIENKPVLGRIAEVRTGKINEQTIEVLWLPTEQLPASIIRKDKTGTVKLQLVEITPLSAAPKKPINLETIANYRQIDAADFGDMENDPFVKKLMSVEGHHAH